MNQEKLREFEPIFYPQSIAVVGASRDEQKIGTRYLKALLTAGFKGKLFPINPKAREIMGLKTFPNINSVPDPVEYVIATIPRELIANLLDDCIQKKVRVIQMFTAGFSETGEEGQRLEKEIIRRARQGGIRVIGPNCIGVYCPASKMPGPWQLGKPGAVAFVSQSGGHTGKLIDEGIAREIRFSKVVSFGNGSDLDSVDYLEYLGADPETKIIGAYLEGVKDGGRFFRLIRELSKSKPVVIWKGGRTEIGARAAASHTGSLAGQNIIWTAALKQVGAIKVGGLEELADTLLAFQFLPKIEDNNVALIGGLVDGAGGPSVAGSDACADVGLNIPPFTEEIREKLKGLIPLEGSITQNPLDLSRIGENLGILSQVMELVDDDPQTSLVILNEDVNLLLRNMSTSALRYLTNFLINFKKAATKPLVIVSPPGLSYVQRAEEGKRLLEAEIPVYPSFERATKAIMNVIKYWRNRSQIL